MHYNANAKNNYERTALIWAAANWHKEVVELLEKAQKNGNGSNNNADNKKDEGLYCSIS